MKKLLCISICLLFICAMLVPAVVFAASNVADTIYFLNPTALTAIDNNLFVADKIEEGKSVILRYDITSGEPQLKDMYEVSGVVTNLASKEDSGLYAVLSDKVIEFDTNFEEQNRWNIADVIDVIYGAYSSDKTEYVLKSDGLLRPGTGGNTINFTNGIACVAMGDSLVYAYKQGNSTAYGEFDGKNTIYPTQNTVSNSNSNPQLTSLALKGMFVWKDKVALYSADSVGVVVVGQLSCEYTSLLSYEQGNIVQVTAHGDNLYILNDNNKIEVFEQNGLGSFDKTHTIGNDELNQNAPTVDEFTSFTLVESKGYPTNIVFKTTTGNTSIGNIITDAKEYIVIGYDGDENSNFYYVLLGDKFGWVKKSDNAKSVNNDEKLNVINTSVGGDGFTYKAKFVSMKAVYVSSLPRELFYNNENYRSQYEQSSKNKIEVTILQKFSEGDIVWYYVTFDYNNATHYGFVRDKDVRVYITNSKDDGLTAIGQRKINSALFSTVKVYNNGNPETMTEENYAYDEDGKQIKLSSGTRVTLISIDDNGVAFIQIKKSNVYGYVYAENLIGVHQITTNATVGLSLLAVAVALGVTLTVVFLRRRKSHKEKLSD